MRGVRANRYCATNDHMKNKIEDNKKYKLGMRLAKKRFETGQDQSWRVYATNKIVANPYTFYGPNHSRANYFLEMGYHMGLRKYGLIKK